MNKVFKFVKSNIKTVVAFTLGLILAGGGAAVVYALAATSVTYTDTNNIGATTVQGAIDKLGERANTWIDPSYIDFTTLATNTNKTILASKNGICIKRNNKVSCFKVNNWSEEQNHIQQVFSDVSCYVGSSRVGCNASAFGCYVYSTGRVDCDDYSDNSYCYVYADGSVHCL